MKTNQFRYATQIAILSFVGSLMFLSACGSSGTGANVSGGGTTSDSSDGAQPVIADQGTGAVGDATTSGIDETNQALSLSNEGLSAGANASGFNLKLSHRPYSFSFISLAYADGTDKTKTCPAGTGDVSITSTCDATTNSALILRDYENSCTLNNRRGDDIIISGTTATNWTDLFAGTCNASSSDYFWTAVQGTGATRNISTDPTTESPTPPSGAAVVQTYADGSFMNDTGENTVAYSGYQSTTANSVITQSVNGSLSIDTTKIRYKTGTTSSEAADLTNTADMIYYHTITTPTPISFTLEQAAGSAPVRTISSGEVDVEHHLAKFILKQNFSDVVYDYNKCACHPISGTVTLTATDLTGATTEGSGTVTFTYSTTNICGTADVTYQGKTLTIPSFEKCI